MNKTAPKVPGTGMRMLFLGVHKGMEVLYTIYTANSVKVRVTPG